MIPNRKGSTIKNSKEEIWFWYCHLMAHEKSNIQLVKYCKNNNLDDKKFQNIKRRFVFCKEHDLTKYKRYVTLAKAYMSCELDRTTFCLQNSCDALQLGAAVTHLNYLDIIETMRVSGASLTPERPDSVPYINYSASTNDNMSFIKVAQEEKQLSELDAEQEENIDESTPDISEEEIYIPNIAHKLSPIIPPPLSDPELLPQQNKIELTIAKGVKIEISPDITSEKILLLINLLKDI